MKDSYPLEDSRGGTVDKKMMIKNKAAIERMRVAGCQLAEIFEEISPYVVADTSTEVLDSIFEKHMVQRGIRAECKGYAGYKHATCISVNDVIVHGIPNKETILKSGDFVTIDVTGSYKGYCADVARYFFIGNPHPVAQKMAETAQKALDSAIQVAKPGNRVFDISACIQEIVEKEGFSIIRIFAGHGIGKNLHEEPDIPNYGERGTGIILREGMTLAIEPMIAERGYEVEIMNDGWTAKTADGGLAAHVEDTVVITKSGADVLTRLKKQS